MSVQASSWAWTTDTTSSGQRLVLLALADTANDTGECWPGAQHLARKTNLSERQVRVHLDALEDMGLLTRKRRRRADGSLGTYTYWLAMTTGSELPAAVDNHPSGSQLPVVHRQPTAAQNRHTQTTSEPSENTAAAFAEFWLAYPRKVGKPTAQRAYTKHVKNHVELIDGLAAWVAHWATLEDQQYVPHPTTWLNRHGWLDQPPAPSPRGRAGTVQTTVDTARQVLEQIAADTQQVTEQLQARRHELEAGDQ
jgi:DNA-binding transcriptional ArsR family regulator